MPERLRQIKHRECSTLFTDYSRFIREVWHVLIEAELQLVPREQLGSVRALRDSTTRRRVCYRCSTPATTSRYW